MAFNPFVALALQAARATFQVPPNATAREVRRNGAITILFGFGILLITSVLHIALRSIGLPLTLTIFPSIVFYAFISVGGYRLLAGKDSFAESSSTPSFRRIGVAIAAILLFIGIPLTLLFALVVIPQSR
jgi:hypothetical protein